MYRFQVYEKKNHKLIMLLQSDINGELGNAQAEKHELHHLCRTQHSVDARGFIMAHNLESVMATASNNHLSKELLMLLKGFIPQASLGWPQLISMMVPEAGRRGARAHRLAWIDETHRCITDTSE